MTGKIDIFQGLVRTTAPGVTVENLLVAASHVTGYRVREITGPSRDECIVAARYAVCALAYRTGRMSLPHIAERVGDRDHTTILHAVRVMTTRERSGHEGARYVLPVARAADSLVSKLSGCPIPATIPAAEPDAPLPIPDLPMVEVRRTGPPIQRGLVIPARRPPIDLVVYLRKLGWSVSGVKRHIESVYGADVARDILAI